MREDAPKFLPLGVVICPHCQGSNLNWRIVCTWCNKDLEGKVEENQLQEVSA